MRVYNKEKRKFETKEYIEKQDTGWFELLRGLEYRKLNEIVTIRFKAEFACPPITQPWQRIATLPESYRPNEAIFLNIFTNEVPSRTIGVSISEIGVIGMLAPVNGATVYPIGTIMYQV